MDSNFQNAAREVSAWLLSLEADYWGTARGAFLVLEQFDPETAWLALEAVGDRDCAARWFAERTGTLCGGTPWEYLATGRVQQVRRILNAIACGSPP